LSPLRCSNLFGRARRYTTLLRHWLR
jgi:hypothetical protein